MTKLASAVLFCALATVHANASIIASWNLTGAPGNQATQPASSSALGVIGNAIVRGAGLDPNVGVNSFNSNDWDDNTADEFVEFGFTVLPGFVVDLADLVIATQSSATGPGTMGLFTSIDSFTSPVHTFSQQPGANNVNTTVNLSSLPNLNPGAFVLRFYEIGNTSANSAGATGGAGTFRIAENSGSDVLFNGTVSAAVPEASASIVWCLLGTLAASVGAVRRLRFTGIVFSPVT